MQYVAESGKLNFSIMGTFRIKLKSVKVVILGLVITILCVGVVARSYHKQRELDSVKTLLQEYYWTACLWAIGYDLGDFPVDIAELQGHDIVTPDKLTEFNRTIIPLGGLNTTSKSSLPLAYSKASFGGKRIVIKISGDVEMMTEKALQWAIQRVADEQSE